MNPADPLQQLRDIHLPEAVSWWPPAPAWWILLVLILLGLASLLYLALRTWKRRAYRRVARRELEANFREWQLGGSDRGFIEKLNSILKRTALRSFPVRDVASLSGRSWCAFLDAQLAKPATPEFAESALATDYYAPQEPQHDKLEQLQQCAVHWLMHHRCPPC